MISRRAMMNDKIVSQSGNTLLLEKCKGSYFNGLTLHGGSTQGSTTGAQLFDFGNVLQRNIANWTNTNILTASDSKDISVDWKILSGTAKNYIAIVCPFKFEAKKTVYLGVEIGQHFLVYSESGGNLCSAFQQSYTPTENFKGYIGIGIDMGKKIDRPLIITYAPNFSTAEPYTGGAPSPSPSYPQEIESAGQSGEIGIEVGNNGYIQKGTYFLDVRPFSLNKGYTYHIKCEKIIENAINCFVLNEYNKNLRNGSELYDYGYTTKKLTIPNSTGIVDKECMMPKKYDGDGYTFTVKAEGLYLYQAVNEPTKNTDEFYIGYAPNILNEEYKKQTLIIPTPGGLPGIPVSSGGNYTDEKGQQWVCDEIDLAKGERVQWIEEYRFTGAEAWFSWGVNNITEGITGFYWYYGSVIPTNHREILNTHAVFSRNVYGGREEGTMANIASGGDDYLIWSVRNEYLEDVSSKDAAVQSFKKLLGEINAKMLYCLATPIRTPLPPETIAAYKALHTYSPTTTVINDAGAGMSVGYRKVRE